MCWDFSRHDPLRSANLLGFVKSDVVNEFKLDMLESNGANEFCRRQCELFELILFL